MKLTVPPLEIAEDEGFSGEKDIFERVEFGERFARLIENANDNPPRSLVVGQHEQRMLAVQDL